ncbi:hypothetical protein ADUPG1_007292 [Aduncisulcus paluster]|uniref:Uncharacterized protein n=1 Tax=Aduncisulcus paluster TaxID=2918883 RepID=A0ABQ5KQV6_9EUKA|nr:hypothetical protein ADUPG1_007292 [Aduncisulcus paluster]
MYEDLSEEQQRYLSYLWQKVVKNRKEYEDIVLDKIKTSVTKLMEKKKTVSREVRQLIFELDDKISSLVSMKKEAEARLDLIDEEFKGQLVEMKLQSSKLLKDARKTSKEYIIEQFGKQYPDVDIATILDEQTEKFD